MAQNHFGSAVCEVHHYLRVAWPVRPIHFVKMLSCEMHLVLLPFTAISVDAERTEPIKRARVGFKQWLKQEHPKAAVQNNQHGYRIANDALNQQNWQQTFIGVPTALRAVLDVVALPASHASSLVGCMPIQQCSEAVSSASIGTKP